MVFEYPVQGGDFTNAGTVSSKVKKMMRQLGVDAGVIKGVLQDSRSAFASSLDSEGYRWQNLASRLQP